MTTTEVKLTARQKAAKAAVEELKVKFDQAVLGLESEDKWVEYIETVAQFGSQYSWGNQLLILIGGHIRGFKPTLVKSFGAWELLAKHEPGCPGKPKKVKGKKQEKCGCDLNLPQRPEGLDKDAEFGLPIWRPFKRKLSKEECDRREKEDGKKIARDEKGRSLHAQLVGWGIARVFDVSQLKRPHEVEVPEPLSVHRRVRRHTTAGQPVLLTGEDTTGALNDVIALLQAEGLTVEYVERHTIDGANGMTNGVWVKVANDLEPAAQVKTLIHEWAHNLLGHVKPGYNYTEHRGQAETEAESVAHVVCGALGLDTSQYSAPYVQGWSKGDIRIIEKAAKAVVKTAVHMLTALDPGMAVDEETEGAEDIEIASLADVAA